MTEINRRLFLRAVATLAGASLVPATGFAKKKKQPASLATHYEGMEASATWRSEALERIEKLRKAEFKVKVSDASGKPLRGAEVSVSMQRHHFGFGGAIHPKYLFDLGEPEHKQFYRDISTRYFHRVTIANGLKWKHYDAQRVVVDQCLDWCIEEQLPVRGHCLVWPRFRRIPKRFHHLRNDKPALKKAIENHIIEMVSRYDEPLIEWDVLNEPFTEHEFMDLLGPDVVKDWFRLTEQANPRLKRYINDFGVLTRPSETHQQFYFDYIRGLLEDGVAVQGIGFQGHIPQQFAPTAPRDLFRTLDRFATLGLPLQVTEFDFETRNLDLQARYTADFLIAMFSHPAMTGLVYWSPFEYVEGGGSKPDAAFFDFNRKQKPNGEVWNSLVNQNWRTDMKLVTDDSGHAEFRGFKGSYDVQATLGTERVTTRSSLIENEDYAELTLPGVVD